MLADIARFLLEILGSLLVALLLLRAWMRYIGMPPRNPVAQFAFAMTNWLVGTAVEAAAGARPRRLGVAGRGVAGDAADRRPDARRRRHARCRGTSRCLRRSASW